jgi:hypothetical protein
MSFGQRDLLVLSGSAREMKDEMEIVTDANTVLLIEGEAQLSQE